jgi:hypothetical protein
MISLGAIAIDTTRTDAKRESRMDKQSPDRTHSNAIDLACKDDRYGSIGIRIATIAFAKPCPMNFPR